MDPKLVLIIFSCAFFGLIIGGLIVGIILVLQRQKSTIEKTDLLVRFGGWISTGCLTLISGIMVLIGFVLPWFWSFSGLTIFYESLKILWYTVKGSPISQLPNTFTHIWIELLVVLIPIIGVKIAIAGYELIFLLSPTSYTKHRRRIIAEGLIKFSVIGLVLLGFYFGRYGLFDFNSNYLFGQVGGINDLNFGFWITVISFVITLAAGILISTLVAITEQISQPEPPHPLLQPKPAGKRCPNCGLTNKVEYTHCIYCGASLQAAPEQGVPPPTETGGG